MLVNHEISTTNQSVWSEMTYPPPKNIYNIKNLSQKIADSKQQLGLAIIEREERQKRAIREKMGAVMISALDISLLVGGVLSTCLLSKYGYEAAAVLTGVFSGSTYLIGNVTLGSIYVDELGGLRGLLYIFIGPAIPIYHAFSKPTTAQIEKKLEETVEDREKTFKEATQEVHNYLNTNYSYQIVELKTKKSLLEKSAAQLSSPLVAKQKEQLVQEIKDLESAIQEFENIASAFLNSNPNT